jgi:hypothetical protein
MLGVKEMQGMQGQLTSNKGPERMGNSHHEKGIAIQSKLFPFRKYQICTRLIFMCIQNEKNYLCRLTINHAFGSETCVYSWYTSPHGSEQVQNFLCVLVVVGKNKLFNYTELQI